MTIIIAGTAGTIDKTMLFPGLRRQEPTPEPTLIQKAPGYGQKAPGYGQKAPGFEQKAPGFEQKAPGFGGNYSVSISISSVRSTMSIVPLPSTSAPCS